MRYIASRIKASDSTKSDVLEVPVPSMMVAEETHTQGNGVNGKKDALSVTSEKMDNLDVMADSELQPQDKNDIRRQTSPSRSVTPLLRVQHEPRVDEEAPRIRATRRQKRKAVDEPKPVRISARKRKQK